MRLSGKLTGSFARESLLLLKGAVELGKQSIELDLREVTSIDSIGSSILNWIYGQNGNLGVDILQPVPGIGENEFPPIARIVSPAKA
ncbi:MAG: hypothetical protein E3J72_22010 [Planctomycetota bacterium]|nr:MAG: hypothetical protein E3J72_22010 [Planctomycetota bacterium]